MKKVFTQKAVVKFLIAELIRQFKIKKELLIGFETFTLIDQRYFLRKVETCCIRIDDWGVIFRDPFINKIIYMGKYPYCEREEVINLQNVFTRFTGPSLEKFLWQVYKSKKSRILIYEEELIRQLFDKLI